MTGGQRALVAQAVDVYKRIRTEIARSVPFWPLGLPRWEDTWIALGLRAPDIRFLAAWRRGPNPAAASAPARVTLPVPELRDQPVTVRILYPHAAGAEARWNPALGAVTVTLPRTPSACVLSLTRS